MHVHDIRARLDQQPADVPQQADADAEALLRPLLPAFYAADRLTDAQRTDWVSWLRRYAARVRVDSQPAAQRASVMRRANPLYVPRNWVAQTAIDAAEQGDLTELESLMMVLRRPYDVQPGCERYAARRPDWARDRPGCSALSCSS